MLIHLRQSLSHTCERKRGPCRLRWWANQEYIGSTGPGSWSTLAWYNSFLVHIIVMGVQVVGRALAQALQQEFAASQAAAGTWGRAGHQCAAASSLPSLRLWEAQQVLSASKLSRKEIQKSYEHLFKVNNRSIGGSFYLQSKVVRAKERLEEELRIQVSEDRDRAATQKVITWLLPPHPPISNL